MIAVMLILVGANQISSCILLLAFKYASSYSWDYNITFAVDIQLANVL